MNDLQIIKIEKQTKKFMCGFFFIKKIGIIDFVFSRNNIKQDSKKYLIEFNVGWLENSNTNESCTHYGYKQNKIYLYFKLISKFWYNIIFAIQ